MTRKNFYLSATIFVVAACFALFLFGSGKTRVFGQTSVNSNVSGAVENAIPVAERPRILVDKTGSSLPVISASAMSENVSYRDTLNWIFGARAQRGWYLYVPLIQQTVNTGANADSLEFARAVALWQKNFGFAPTGIIDADTLSQMVKNWQSERLNSSQYATDEQLLNAPISDFYDSTRAADLLKVERDTYIAYKRMTAAAAKDLNLKTTSTGELAPDEKFLKIVSAFRSHEHQERLRAASPNSGSAGLAVNSPHFTGHALDLYVGGEPVTTKDFNRAIQVQTPAYKWLVKNAAHFGFYPYYYEPWHWEYVPQR